MNYTDKERLALAALLIPDDELTDAEKMWEKVLKAHEATEEYVDAEDVKREYCDKRHIVWKNRCVFCEYLTSCEQCPIVSCGMKSIYDLATTESFGKQKNIEYTKKILEIIQQIRFMKLHINRAEM